MLRKKKARQTRNTCVDFPKNALKGDAMRRPSLLDAWENQQQNPFFLVGYRLTGLSASGNLKKYCGFMIQKNCPIEGRI
jgi:hypothetical protein